MEARKLSVGALGSYQPRRLALLLSRFPAQSREAMELPRLRYLSPSGRRKTSPRRRCGCTWRNRH